MKERVKGRWSKRRIMAVFLSICLVMGNIPMTAFAEEAENGSAFGGGIALRPCA